MGEDPVLIGCIGEITGCSDSEADKVIKELAGPNNPIAQKIQSLSRGSAYQTGMQDGLQESAAAAQKLSMTQADIMTELERMGQIKDVFFDLLATQNRFDATVLNDYRRGWNDGWNSTQRIR